MSLCLSGHLSGPLLGYLRGGCQASARVSVRASIDLNCIMHRVILSSSNGGLFNIDLLTHTNCCLIYKLFSIIFILISTNTRLLFGLIYERLFKTNFNTFFTNLTVNNSNILIGYYDHVYANKQTLMCVHV